jgi:HK97 family phage major capsid protein
LGRTIQTTHDRKIPVVLSKGEASWIDELEPIGDSDDTFGQVALSAYKAATLVKVSDELLEDLAFDLEGFIYKQFAERIGELEEEAFANGDGVQKPLGILRSAPVGTVTNDIGTLVIDDLIDLYHSIKQAYRKNATWVMGSDTERFLYKIKTAQGKNIWQPSLQNGVPNLLLGRPVEICDSMPFVAAGNKPVLFGDFNYFLIADRQNRSIKRLNELYATKGQVGFLASQRVDARLVLPEAIKCLQVKESGI